MTLTPIRSQRDRPHRFWQQQTEILSPRHGFLAPQAQTPPVERKHLWGDRQMCTKGVTPQNFHQLQTRCRAADERGRISLSKD